MWDFRCVLCRKRFPQMPHECGRSPVWLLRCFFRCPLWVKLLQQKEQQKGFSPVWILMCIFRSPFRPHSFPHRGQQCSFMPAWLATCSFREVLLLQCFPQTWQHFGPLWELMCAIRFSVDSSVFPHTAQMTSAFLEWKRKAWFTKNWLDEKGLSHRWQWKADAAEQNGTMSSASLVVLKELRLSSLWVSSVKFTGCWFSCPLWTCEVEATGALKSSGLGSCRSLHSLLFQSCVWRWISGFVSSLFFSQQTGCWGWNGSQSFSSGFCSLGQCSWCSSLIRSSNSRWWSASIDSWSAPPAALSSLMVDNSKRSGW